jgi:hypothetical protein
MVATLKPIHAQILGATVIELLHGQLSDETINAVDSINRDDVPEPLDHVVGFMHGMTNDPDDRQECISMLLSEIADIAQEAMNKIQGKPAPDNR